MPAEKVSDGNGTFLAISSPSASGYVSTFVVHSIRLIRLLARWIASGSRSSSSGNGIAVLIEMDQEANCPGCVRQTKDR